ncbi:YscQ/HrcQ family type III secretion apparatus protein [Escherichia coli]|nr:YscQ/HrcQ family type III secretion apparatus protein [Escherichia coli]
MDKVEMENAPEDTNEFFNIHDDLKQLPVKLEFVLHSQKVTYDEISRFFDKEILSLPSDAEKKIRISANGMAIGVGELVQINDHLGVQIIQWPGNKNVAE